MTRQCDGCGTALPDQGRSPRCPRCKAERDRARNRENVQAHRDRERAARPPPPIQLPSDAARKWLGGSELGIAEPIAWVQEILGAGRPGTDPEIGEAVRDALGRYDECRAEFEAWVAENPGPEGAAAEWRSFFEAVRGVVQ